MKTLVVTVFAGLALAACAHNRSDSSYSSAAEDFGPGAASDPAIVAVVYPVVVVDDVLTDPDGMTLYVLDTDVAGDGRSTCNGACAEAWPPLVAVVDAVPVEGYTILARDDGTKQWAHKGKPLYRYSKDKENGDKRGDNANNRWHAARP
jgi:predicted lipoprotein with Yx(FWY)xxD motif